MSDSLTHARRVMAASRWLTVLAALGLMACARAPLADWQFNAHGALERALAAHLTGDARVAELEFDRARAEVARTGRVDLASRVELARCAAQLASLVFESCAGFERLRPDAPPAEQAYADFLLGRLDPGRIELLPARYRRVAMTGSGAADDLTTVRDLPDPLSQVVAAAIWLRAGRSTPEIIGLAVDAASSQGWRRPLLAWLGVQLKRASDGQDAQSAERLQRRIDLVLQDTPKKP